MELQVDSVESFNKHQDAGTLINMPVNIFIVESELPESETSVKGTWEVEQELLTKAGQLGQHEFVEGQSRKELEEAMSRFAEWSDTIPCDEPILLWLSIHGRAPEDETHVGTSGETAEGQLIEWFKFLEPVKKSNCPARIVVLMDVCWGGSPTAASRLTTPAVSRPHMVFGPRRPAYRNELDSAFEEVIGLLKTSVLPAEADAKAIVDKLNLKYPPVVDGEFYRCWWWDDSGIKQHPANTVNVAKRKD